MHKTIRQLIDELYALEPNLRSKEDQIVSIIETMLKNRPTIHIDETMKKKLRKEIMATFAKEDTKVVWNFNWGKNFYTGLSTGFAVFFIFSLGFLFFREEGNHGEIAMIPPSSKNHRLSFAPTIEQLPPSAFGPLALSESSGNAGQTMNMGGGTSPAMAPMPESNSKMAVSDRIMVMPPTEIVTYRYIYTGELDIPSGTLPVYAKNVAPFNSSEIGSFLNGMSFDGFDIQALKSPKLSAITMLEDEPFGYIVSMDFAGGTLSLYQNYEKWPQMKCSPTGCEEPKKLTESDIPQDEEIINISDAFLAEYGIDMNLYGTGRVEHQNINIMPMMQSPETTSFISDSITITYPTILDGKFIYEENGSPRGITLTYDVRNKRIASLYGVGKESLGASNYPVTTDREGLMKIIGQGGRYGGYATDESGSGKIVDIVLGKPEIANVHIGSALNDGKWQDYYVPALIFRVVSKPADVYVSETLTIPLIDEFLKVERSGPMPYATPGMMVR